MNNIQIFKHKMFGEIRTMTDEKGETFFVGKDVATALGYKNPLKAIRDHIDEEDKTVNESFTVNGTPLVIINESGLYALILSSKLEQAKAFKHWVTSEVLPQIRKTGGYIPTKDAEGRELTELEIVCLALKIQQKTIEEQNKAIEEQLRAIEALGPKAAYCDEVLESVSCFTTTQVAKELNMTVHDLTQLLLKRKVMYRQSGQYLLYAEYARKGYARNRTHSYCDAEGDHHTRTYLVWTERGRKFIHRIVKTEEITIPFMLSIDLTA